MSVARASGGNSVLSDSRYEGFQLLDEVHDGDDNDEPGMFPHFIWSIQLKVNQEIQFYMHFSHPWPGYICRIYLNIFYQWPFFTFKFQRPTSEIQSIY